MNIIAHPIIPVRGTRPGGGNYGSQTYIEALQNRNKTNLLDALGSAPELPIIEEPVPFEWKPLTSLVVHKSIDLLERVTGVSSFYGNMQSIAFRPLELAKNRFWGQLETVFLPIRKSLRQVEIEYETFLRANQTGAMTGAFAGGLIGSFLGPFGYFLGTIFGGLLGAAEESLIPIDESVGTDYERNYPGWKPPEYYENVLDSKTGRGGAPDYSYIPTPAVMATHRPRMAAIRRTQVLSKVRQIEMRLY